ncbi:MAG: hypothetical protein P1V34_11370 [Alphaproteobacteria bacterium]|nr:hypothetical protein [Alphaproteobacteria bacterium]
MKRLLILLLLWTGPAQAQAQEDSFSLRGLSLGMTREAALETLSQYRFFCEPFIHEGYHRYHGTLCRYREYHFGIFFSVRPDNDTIYRIEIEDKYPNGFDLEKVDSDLIKRFGIPDVSKRNAMFSGSYLRQWGDFLTVRLEDYEQDAIRLVLADPKVTEDVLHAWYDLKTQTKDVAQ